jgi:integration host factor subunit beta
MIKSELINKIYRKSELSLEDTSHVVNVIIDRMTKELGSGGRVEVRGFGSFSLGLQKERVGMNPKTREAIEIPEHYKVHFKPGKELRRRVALTLER